MPIPCKRKLEVNFQISQYALESAFIGSYTSEISENNGLYASVLGAHCFLDTKRFCIRKANCETHDEKMCYT